MIKNQSGVALSTEWMNERGIATYGSQETSGSLAARVTRPITRQWYDSVVKTGVCLRCSSPLVKSGNPNGGFYMACSAGYQCYHIGWRDESNRGEERVV